METYPISSDTIFMEAADVLVQKNLVMYEAERKLEELKYRLVALNNLDATMYTESGNPPKFMQYLKKAWDWIIRMLKKLKEFIFRNNKNIAPTDTVIVDQKAVQGLRGLKKAWLNVKNFVRAGKGKLKENRNWKIFIGILSGLVIGGSIFLLIKKRRNRSNSGSEIPVEQEIPANGVEVSGKEIIEVQNTIEDITETVTKVAEEKAKTPFDANGNYERIYRDSAESIRRDLDHMRRMDDFYGTSRYNQDKITDEWVSELNNLTKLVHTVESRVNELFAPAGDGYKQLDYEKDPEKSLDELLDLRLAAGKSFRKLISMS